MTTFFTHAVRFVLAHHTNGIYASRQCDEIEVTRSIITKNRKRFNALTSVLCRPRYCRGQPGVGSFGLESLKWTLVAGYSAGASYYTKNLKDTPASANRHTIASPVSCVWSASLVSWVILKLTIAPIVKDEMVVSISAAFIAAICQQREQRRKEASYLHCLVNANKTAIETFSILFPIHKSGHDSYPEWTISFWMYWISW